MPDTDTPRNTVNLAGTMPPDQANGLLALTDDLIANPGARRFAVVEFYAMKRTHRTDDGTWQAVVRFNQIEPLDGEPADTAEQLLKTAQDSRLRAEAAARGELEFGVEVAGDEA